jgi:phosphoglycolate phosphatase-like HAD superfamily hydrolase
LFDVDGTLFDTNYLHTLAWSRAFADAGEWAPMNAIHRLVATLKQRLRHDQLHGEFEQFVAGSSVSLLRTAYLVVRDLSVAEDLVQECLSVSSPVAGPGFARWSIQPRTRGGSRST